MDTEIERYVGELRHTTTVAWLNYEIWWVYKGEETRTEYVGVMNEYALFFQTSLHAHFVALLVELYRLYETRNDTYNIPRFLRLLRDKQRVTSVVSTELEQLYSQAKPLWVKVNVLRNKAFGHRSTAHSVGDVFVEAGMTPNELRDIVKITRELLNTATQALASTSHAFNLSSRNDTLRMLQVLKRAMTANPSIERTVAGKPSPAAHVKR